MMSRGWISYGYNNLCWKLCLQGSNDKTGVELMKRTPANINWPGLRKQMGRKSCAGDAKSTPSSELLAAQ